MIPTFNRAEYLPRAVESALSQDYNDIEVIVSDNASTDNTMDVVERFKANKKFKYYRNNKNLGMVRNWKKELEEYSSGDYFIILSDDDYLVDNEYISKAVKLITQYPDIGIVYANGYLYYEDTEKMEKLILPFKFIESGKTVFLSRQKIFPQDFCLCNVLFNRDLALKLNAFSNEYNISCDSELFLKMCIYCKVGIIQDLVSVYQIHSNNLIKNLNTDIKLITNNYYHLLEPYKLAKQSNLFTDEELVEWQDRVMVLYMFYILITILIFQKNNYDKVEEFLKDIDPIVFYKVQGLLRFRIVFMLHRIKILKIIYKFNKSISLISKLGDKILFRR